MRLGSHSHIDQLVKSLTSKKSQLRSLDLSSCELDTESISELADGLVVLPALEELTMTATGNGPWRGPVHGVKYANYTAKNYTLTVGEAGEARLVGLGLGPEDARLIAAWMRRPIVAQRLKLLDLSQNAILGNREWGASSTPVTSDSLTLGCHPPPDDEMCLVGENDHFSMGKVLEHRGEHRLLSHALLRSTPDMDDQNTKMHKLVCCLIAI